MNTLIMLILALFGASHFVHAQLPSLEVEREIKQRVVDISKVREVLHERLLGGVNGGGGNAVVCRHGNQIHSVEMLDLYESKILYDRKYPSFENSSVDEILAWAADKLYSYSNLRKSPIMFQGIHANFHYLPKGVRLDPIQDSEHIFLAPNCKIEQIANFYSNDKIFIVKDFYDKMDNLNKAALIVHETIYWLDRVFTASNSRYARRVVGAIFDETFEFRNPVPLSGPSRLICSTPLGKLDGHAYEFNPGLKKITSFVVAKKGDHYRLYFTVLNGHTVHSQKYFDVRYPVDFQWLVPRREEVAGWSSSTRLSSNLDSGEFFTFSFRRRHASEVLGKFERRSSVNQIRGSWIGSDPGESFDDLEFVCSEVSSEFFE